MSSNEISHISDIKFPHIDYCALVVSVTATARMNLTRTEEEIIQKYFSRGRHFYLSSIDFKNAAK